MAADAPRVDTANRPAPIVALARALPKNFVMLSSITDCPTCQTRNVRLSSGSAINNKAELELFEADGWLEFVRESPRGKPARWRNPDCLRGNVFG
jgi:hypothetical protein